MSILNDLYWRTCITYSSRNGVVTRCDLPNQTLGDHNGDTNDAISLIGQRKDLFAESRSNYLALVNGDHDMPHEMCSNIYNISFNTAYVNERKYKGVCR